MSQTSSIDAADSGHATGTSRSLLGRARQDDPAAWEKLVRLYAPLVAIWCRQAGLQEDDAGDVFQDVFQAVARKLSAFRKDREGDTFRGWLRTITQNKIRDQFRKAGRGPQAAGGTEAHQRLQQFPMADVLSDPADPSSLDSVDLSQDDTNAERVVLHNALEFIRSNFAEQTWRAFVRTAVDGQSSTDVAEELGMSPGAVRVAKSRVLQRLREELGDLL